MRTLRILPTWTKARHEWLEHLDRVGYSYTRGGNVAHQCCVLGWSEPVPGWGQGVAPYRLTTAGHAKLNDWRQR